MPFERPAEHAERPTFPHRGETEPGNLDTGPEGVKLTGMRRALVLLHEENEGAGRLVPALERAGFQVDTRLRRVEPADQDVPLLVVMGGMQAVYEASRLPYLLDELRVLRYRLARGLPSLGICLGSQLLASAAGARVFPGERGMELGPFPVHLTPAGAKDEVFGALPAKFTALHWHGDTHDPVPGGKLLASTECYAQQAYRIGNSYGLQFHPELTGEAFLQWADAAPADVARAGVARAQLEGIRSHPDGEPAIPTLLDALAKFYASAAAAVATPPRP